MSAFQADLASAATASSGLTWPDVAGLAVIAVLALGSLWVMFRDR